MVLPTIKMGHAMDALKYAADAMKNRQTRTYEDLAKNDPEALARLFKENRTEFERIAKEHERRTDLPPGWPIP